jgi:hypothetical protein
LAVLTEKQRQVIEKCANEEKSLEQAVSEVYDCKNEGSVRAIANKLEHNVHFMSELHRARTKSLPTIDEIILSLWSISQVKNVSARQRVESLMIIARLMLAKKREAALGEGGNGQLQTEQLLSVIERLAEEENKN